MKGNPQPADERPKPHAVTITERDEPEPGEVRVADLRRYVLVPDDYTVIRAADVARETQGYGVRGAARIFCTSPSTISRFLRAAGYSLKKGYEVRE